MSWSAEIEEIQRRRALAEQCGGAEAVARHHAAGKLTIRERIDGLLDAKTFQEVGKLAGSAKYDAKSTPITIAPAPPYISRAMKRFTPGATSSRVLMSQAPRISIAP